MAEVNSNGRNGNLGPSDPSDPRKWSSRKRVFHLLPPAFLCFVATMASSICTPSLPEIQDLYNCSPTVALFGLSFYVLALAIGPLIGAPLSETYGRNFVYQTTPPIAMLFTAGAGFSNSLPAFIICRFFSGLFFSPALAVGAGTIADLFAVEERAIPSLLYVVPPFLGPALGPVIGSFVTAARGWRWVQWTILFFGTAAWLSTLVLSETNDVTTRKSSGSQQNSLPRTTRGFITVILFRPLEMLYIEPIVAFLSLYTAFNFAVLFAFFAAFPYVFTSIYEFGISENGLVFLAIGIGILPAILAVALFNKFKYLPKREAEEREAEERAFEEKNKKAHEQRGLASDIEAPSMPRNKRGPTAIEYRLWCALLGSVLMPIGLLGFALTARLDGPWYFPVLSAIPFACGNFCVFVGAATYLVDTYTAKNGASALAANGVLRYVLGAIFPLFTLQMYQKLGVFWATATFLFVSVVLLPIPWVLFCCGPQIRSKGSSKFKSLPVEKGPSAIDV